LTTPKEDGQRTRAPESSPQAIQESEERKEECRCDQITNIDKHNSYRHNIPSRAIIKAIFQFDDCCDNPFVGYVALLRFPLAEL